jgi:hypothetical protein
LGADGWQRPWRLESTLTACQRCPAASGARYQGTVCCTASRCRVGSSLPKAASNLLASTAKGRAELVSRLAHVAEQR